MNKFYNLELNELVADQVKFKNNLMCMFPSGRMPDGDGGTVRVTDAIDNISRKSIANLKSRFYPPEPPVSNGKFSHMWIGINPPPDTITPEDLFKQTQECVKKYPWAEEHAYSLEMYTPNGYRPHIHMIFHSNKDHNYEKPYRIRQALANHYNLNKQCIECKSHHGGYLYKEHIEYVKGNKGSSKMDNVKLDNINKIQLNIPQYILELPTYFDSLEEEEEDCV